MRRSWLRLLRLWDRLQFLLKFFDSNTRLDECLTELFHFFARISFGLTRLLNFPKCQDKLMLKPFGLTAQRGLPSRDDVTADGQHQDQNRSK